MDDRHGDGAAESGGVLETTVERIVPGGLGLAHASGKTLFVARAAPGDRLRVRVHRVRGRLAYATIVEILTPSPARVEPPHPGFARCGGCDFQHLAYEAQLAAKVEIVRDCLRRIGGTEPPADLPITPSPRQWGYRARAEWRHDAERGLLGYVEQGSHRVCDIAEDPIVVPALQAVLADLRRRLAAGALPTDVGAFHAASGDDIVSIDPPLIGEEPAEVVATIGDERYAYAADCFFQANPGVLPPLVVEALRFAPEVDSRADGPAIDLYCGVGLFTLPLARRFGRVVGVEGHRRSASFAARNASEAGLGNVRIEAAPVGRWLEDGWRTFGRAPLVLLDPPRGGMDAMALRGVLRLRPARIAYVSCDPATLARDLRALQDRGYRLNSVAVFDMFPQTHHVEVVAHVVADGTRDRR